MKSWKIYLSVTVAFFLGAFAEVINTAEAKSPDALIVRKEVLTHAQEVSNTRVFSITTPEGVRCVLAERTGGSATSISCDFSTRGGR